MDAITLDSISSIHPVAIMHGLILTVPWVVYIFIVDILLSLLLPISFLFPNWVYNISSDLAFSVWRIISYIFEECNGAKITISGDPIPRHETAIVLANHVGWSDFYMIQKLAIQAGMLGRSRYFAKKELRQVPFIGWGMWAMNFPMVSRNWMKDKSELDRVFKGVVENNFPMWLVSFSEGTRYTLQKNEEARAWCQQRNKTMPQHLLYPRTKGFVTTVQHLRKAKHVKAVYDITIAYAKGNQFMEAPPIWETVSTSDISGRGGYKFHADVRRFDLEDLPLTDDGLAKWLEDRWVAKGVWLEQKKLEWGAI